MIPLISCMIPLTAFFQNPRGLPGKMRSAQNDPLDRLDGVFARIPEKCWGARNMIPLNALTLRLRPLLWNLSALAVGLRRAWIGWVRRAGASSRGARWLLFSESK